MANIVARVEGSEQWTDYGDVTFYDAARRHAKHVAGSIYGQVQYTWRVEVQDRFDDTVPACVIEVDTEIEARIRNPRQGAE
jgi:hypothetical protein